MPLREARTKDGVKRCAPQPAKPGKVAPWLAIRWPFSLCIPSIQVAHGARRVSRNIDRTTARQPPCPRQLGRLVAWPVEPTIPYKGIVSPVRPGSVARRHQPTAGGGTTDSSVPPPARHWVLVCWADLTRQRRLLALSDTSFISALRLHSAFFRVVLLREMGKGPLVDAYCFSHLRQSRMYQSTRDPHRLARPGPTPTCQRNKHLLSGQVTISFCSFLRTVLRPPRFDTRVIRSPGSQSCRALSSPESPARGVEGPPRDLSYVTAVNHDIGSSRTILLSGSCSCHGQSA